MLAPAITFFPLPPANSEPLARFSDSAPLNSSSGRACPCATSQRQARSVALTIMFMPWASAVQ